MIRRHITTKRFHARWSRNFAYAIGLMATDGSLSSDGRHISFCSKDIEQVRNLAMCFGLTNKIGKNISGNKKNVTHRIQFGNINLWQFMVEIGITPAKSKTIEKVAVPNAFFFDFLRGCFDGDGSVHSYYDKRWKSSFLFYASFASASKKFIVWLQMKIFEQISIKGHVTKSINSSVFQLKYGKRESLILFGHMYHNPPFVSLKRKRLKILGILDIVGSGSKYGRKQ